MSKAAELAALIGSQTAQGNKNLIINGAQNVAQRGTSFNFVHDGTRVGFITDRFSMAIRSTGDEYECTVAQVSDAPAGFSKSYKLTTTTAESAVGSDEYYVVGHPIEAQNLQSLQYGTSGALTVTLSFYVKSSLTGTFGFSMYKPDNTERVIAKTYTISSADTWEKKTITFAGDTSIAINNDNGGGLYLYWLMGAGTIFNSGASTTEWANYGSGTTWFQASATNDIVTTVNATWQLTGVQLEIGDVATAFEHEDIGTTLRKCKRYFQKVPGKLFGGYGAGADYLQWYFDGEMRAAPTVTGVTGTVDIDEGDFTTAHQIYNPSSSSYAVYAETSTADAEL